MKLNDMIAEHKISEESKEKYLTMLKQLHDSIASDSEFVLNGNSFYTALHRLRQDVNLLNAYAKPSDYMQVQAEKDKQKKEADKIETELIKSKRAEDKSLFKSSESFASFKIAQKKLGRITEPGLSQLKKQFITTTSANVELLMPNGAVYRFNILELSRNPNYNSTDITGAITFTKLAHYANQLRDTNSAERLAYDPMAKSIDKLINAGYKMAWKAENNSYRRCYQDWPDLGRLANVNESYKLQFDTDTLDGREVYVAHSSDFMMRPITFSPGGSLVFHNGENELSFTVEQIFETKRIYEILKNVKAEKRNTSNRYKYGTYGNIYISAARGEGVHPIGTEYIGATLINKPTTDARKIPFDSSDIYGEGDLIRLAMRDDD